MKQMIITVNFGNDAMQTVAQAFEAIESAVKAGRYSIMDANGNKVGSVAFK